MKKESNKKKKYWLIPTISISIAMLIALAETIILFMYPDICGICFSNVKAIPGLATEIDYYYTSYFIYVLQIATFIGIISLAYQIVRHIIKSKTDKKEKVKYWLMPIMGIVLTMINYIINIKLDSYHETFADSNGALVMKCACDLSDKLAPIRTIIGTIIIGLILLTIVSIPFAIYSYTKQNKKLK